jgi:crotonobetainyl-CoA:carnitine CoA-transferase CaiB-like acyl-CoA transferase
MDRNPALATGLAGLRVIDFAGPPAALCAKLLADLGADVVRFEPPGGDPTRRQPPLAAGTTGDLASLYFRYYNLNQRSVTLDLVENAGQNRLRALVPNADVLIESFAPGHLANLGLGPDDLRALNPRLVIVSVTPYGQSGPFRAYRGSDLTGWAAGGCLMLAGDPNRAPLTGPATPAYQVASLNATIALLAALWRRRQTGLGAQVDVSVQEAVASVAESMWSFYHYQHERVVRMDGDMALACPFRVYESRDGYAFVGLSGRAQWQALLDWMAETTDIRDLTDPKYLETTERTRDRAHMNAAVRAWARTQSSETLFREGARRGIPNAPVRRIPEVLEDEQIRDRRLFVGVADPTTGRELRSPGLPYRCQAGPLRARSAPAPNVGADTEAVLREWGVPTRYRGYPAEFGGVPAIAGRNSPLAGVKVLELAWQVAGTTVARALGDLGADVVKVEGREVGDPLRGIPPFQDGQFGYNRSGTFFDLNRNKRSLTLNLKHPGARPVLAGLVRWADIVTENFTAGTLDRLGIPYATLRAINPRVILVSVAGYGQTGPRRTWPCFHPTASALSGLTGLFAYPGGVPSGFGISYMDYTPGFVGAIGALEALIRRERTGEGDHIDVSQVETGVYFLGPELLAHQVNGSVAVPEGNRAGALGAPLQDVFAAREPDTWVAVTAPDAASLAALANLVGLDRWASPEAVGDALAGWFRAREAWDAFHTLQRAGVPAAVAAEGRDLMGRDPHLAAREMFVAPSHSELGPTPVPRFPAFFDGAPPPVQRAAPLVGEHTEEILRELLGLSEEQIASLIVDEVV